ncbi:MAG: PHP domain-containing protein [Dehalococcoidia bacterium]|nr:PHP domain-containing protein [Dehalococcoidia bacterium]
MTIPPRPPGPIAALRRIAYLLEYAGESSYRASAFRRAADAVAELAYEDLRARAEAGTLRELPGLGGSTERVVLEALAGQVPAYLDRLEREHAEAPKRPGDGLFTALRGDCHVHSNWSDGGASIRDMAEAAVDLGHEYVVLTDHSPSLRVARGLSPDRLREQLEVVARLNEELAPFRILTGIEVDILTDGALDQEDELLSRLDVVVGSVHSLLRMERDPMTARMLAAIANPHLDVLGHCTGRMRAGRRDRPESEFDAAEVFSACARYGKAVEINSLPPRLDPPRRLMAQALEAGCLFSLDSDAHAPGQLAWKIGGADRAVEVGVPAERIVTTWPAEDLLAWARSHEATPAPASRGAS